jgi:hypothetical protein
MWNSKPVPMLNPIDHPRPLATTKFPSVVRIITSDNCLGAAWESKREAPGIVTCLPSGRVTWLRSQKTDRLRDLDMPTFSTLLRQRGRQIDWKSFDRLIEIDVDWLIFTEKMHMQMCVSVSIHPTELLTIYTSIPCLNAKKVHQPARWRCLSDRGSSWQCLPGWYPTGWALAPGKRKDWRRKERRFLWLKIIENRLMKQLNQGLPSFVETLR